MLQDATSNLTEKEHFQFEKLLGDTFDYVDNPSFHPATEAVNNLFGEKSLVVPNADTTWYINHVSHTTQHNAPIHKYNLLTKEQEALLFLRFNFAKFQLTEYLKKIRDEGFTPALARVSLRWHAIVLSIRKQLVEMNLALVLSLVRKQHNNTNVEDSIGQGNIKLFDAVNKFDVARGFKFSTYFWWTFIRSMLRTREEDAERQHTFPVSYDPELDNTSEIYDRKDNDENVQAMRYILEHNVAHLTVREKFVIMRRWFETHEDGSRYSLEEIGNELEQLDGERNVSRTCIQLVERKALAKIKAAWLDLMV